MEGSLDRLSREADGSHGKDQAYPSSESLQAVLESLEHPFYVIDADDYTVSLANLAARLEQVHGVATCHALIHRSDKPCRGKDHLCPLEIVRRTKKPVTVEHIHYDKEGNPRNVEVHGIPILDSEGKVKKMIEYCLDITSRKRVEEASRLKEDRYRSYIELTGQLAWTTDADGEVAEDIPIWRRFTGQTEQEVTGWGWLEALHPEDRERTVETWKDAVEKKIPYETEYRIRKYDGTYHHFLARGVPVFGEDGSILEWVGTCINVTDRKKAEEEIRNLARFPSENPSPVIRISQNGTILYANTPGSKLLEKWERRIGGRAPEEWCRFIADVVHSNQVMIRETEIQGRIVSFAISPIGEAGYVNMYGRDITENRQAEQQLREARDELETRVNERTAELTEILEALQVSESRLAEAQRIAHLGNWGWDIVSNQLWWSDEVYRVFGAEPKDFGATNEAFLSHVHPEDLELVQQSVTSALYEHRPYSVDHRIVRPDGTTRVVHEEAEVEYDGNQNPIRMVGTVQDVTEQKQVEEELLLHRRQLRSLTAEMQLSEERERRRIAADLHDSIGQILAFSARELVALQKAASSRVAVSLQEVCDQLEKAIQQTRTLTFDLSPSVLYDLGFEVAVEDLIEQFAAKEGVQFGFENSEELKPLTYPVKILLYRAVRELLINVRKHAKARAVKISLGRVNDDICITVEDDGIGFDPSILEASLHRPKGFGLLSIRERLAHLGGQFRVESGKGRGTRVVMLAPLERDSQRGI